MLGLCDSLRSFREVHWLHQFLHSTRASPLIPVGNRQRQRTPSRLASFGPPPRVTKSGSLPAARRLARGVELVDRVDGVQREVGVGWRLIWLGHLGAARVHLHAAGEIELHRRAVERFDARGATDGCEQHHGNISTHATDDSHVPLGHWRVLMK